MLKRSAQRYQLFAAGRVDGDGVVKIRLARAHFYGDGKALQHFINAVANHLDADDFFFRTDADQFHQGFRRMGGKGARHRRETGAIGFDVFRAVLPARGGFIEADNANRRVGEHHRRDVFVIQMRLRLVVKEARGKTASGGDSDRRQLCRTGDVADGVNAGNVGVLPGIDRNFAVVARGDACGGEVEGGGVGAPSERLEEEVGGECFAVIERDDAVRAVRGNVRDLRAAMDADALRAHGVG